VRKIGTRWEVRANASFVKSETEVILKSVSESNGVKVFIPYDTLSRPMYGQAPYVLNAIVNYNLERQKAGLTLSYNVQGKRLVFAATEIAPDVYEMPRHLIDVKMTKAIGEHFTAAITVRDILNQPVRRAFDLKEGEELDFDSFRWGTGFTFGLTYRL
jgi:hypothetical protein